MGVVPPFWRAAFGEQEDDEAAYPILPTLIVALATECALDRKEKNII
jgi:hypothetical protein